MCAPCTRGWADAEGVREWVPVFRAVTPAFIWPPGQGADITAWLGGTLEVVGAPSRLTVAAKIAKLTVKPSDTRGGDTRCHVADVRGWPCN